MRRVPIQIITRCWLWYTCGRFAWQREQRTGSEGVSLELCRADIGVIGGSGFYSLIECADEIDVDTPYGPPSDVITVGQTEGKRVAFLARHARGHRIPPHMINYRANIWAMKSLGVKRIIAPAAVGSLQAHIQPGDFVVMDQFVDRTREREDSFRNDSVVPHVSGAEPFCADLRDLAIQAVWSLGIPVHDHGVNVVIQGPRFSTAAESRWFTQMEWATVNMTQYPEVILAAEQDICYVGIGLVTDYDAGLVVEPGIEPVNAADAMTVFRKNSELVRLVVKEMISRMDTTTDCKCLATHKCAPLE
jgi:5'-methylthioadenosine phosphorylase